MPRRILTGFLSLIAFFTPAILLGQMQVNGFIGGQVRVGGGDFPPHQIMVELRLHDSTINTVYTDTQGRFAFPSEIINSYRVVINDEGYYPVDEAAEVRPEALYVNLNIFLRPRESHEKPDPLGARALGGNPYLVDPGDYNKRFPKKAVKEYEHGLDAEHKGKADDAISHYLTALKMAPDYFPAHNNLGAIYLSKADFKSAEEQFRNVIRLDGNDAEAYFNLANVLLLTTRYPESEQMLSSGLQRSPDSAFGRFLQGCLEEHNGNLAQAEVSLRRAAQLNPAMWQARLQVANLYIRENRREEAIRELEDFLKTFPAVPATPKAKEVLHRLQEQASAANAAH